MSNLPLQLFMLNNIFCAVIVTSCQTSFLLDMLTPVITACSTWKSAFLRLIQIIFYKSTQVRRCPVNSESSGVIVPSLHVDVCSRIGTVDVGDLGAVCVSMKEREYMREKNDYRWRKEGAVCKGQKSGGKEETGRMWRSALKTASHPFWSQWKLGHIHTLCCCCCCCDFVEKSGKQDPRHGMETTELGE